MSTWVSVKKTQEICMHHLARRTSLVGRQPEALEGGGGWWKRMEERGWRRRREEQRVQNNRWELSGKWKENEVQCWGGGKWWNEQDGHHRREQGNNTEAIRENGGILSLCYIISTDSSIMHNLHRFHNTPHALILGQLSSRWHFVGWCA